MLIICNEMSLRYTQHSKCCDRYATTWFGRDAGTCGTRKLTTFASYVNCYGNVDLIFTLRENLSCPHAVKADMVLWFHETFNMQILFFIILFLYSTERGRLNTIIFHSGSFFTIKLIFKFQYATYTR